MNFARTMHSLGSNITEVTQLLLLPVVRAGLLVRSPAGGLRLNNIVPPTGGTALLYLPPTKPPAKGASLPVPVDNPKTRRDGIAVSALSQRDLCFASEDGYSLCLSGASAVAGQPIRHFLVGPPHVGSQTS